MYKNNIQYKQRVESSRITSPKVVYLEGMLGSGVTHAFNEISKRLYNKGWSIVRPFNYKEEDIREAPNEDLISLINRLPTKVHVNTLFLGGPMHIITRLFWNQDIYDTKDTKYPCLSRCITNMYSLLPGLTVLVTPPNFKKCINAVRLKELSTPSGKEVSILSGMRLYPRYKNMLKCVQFMPNFCTVKSYNGYVPKVYQKIKEYWRKDAT